MRAMASTTATGSSPMAVSPDSITALVPSNTALATSDTSARVGVGAVIIDSSIWVAVITGFPWATPVRMISFWMCGTSSSGSRTPRSPRATITRRLMWTMSSRFVTAGPVSILATTIGPSGPTARWIVATSSAVCTNDTATASTPAASTPSRRRRSSSVGERSATRSSGSDTPGRPRRMPPLVTDGHHAVDRRASVTTSTTPPSPRATRRRRAGSPRRPPGRWPPPRRCSGRRPPPR